MKDIDAGIVDFILEVVKDAQETEEYAVMENAFVYFSRYIEPFTRKTVKLFITRDSYDGFISSQGAIDFKNGYFILSDKERIIEELIRKHG